MFSKFNDQIRTLLTGGQRREELATVMNELQAVTAPITPRLEIAFDAFDLQEIKCVIVGQYPYPAAGAADGRAFSCKKLQPSVKNIYTCLLSCGEILTAPAHGDLSAWTARGVLLLNMALTTVVGKSAAHSAVWRHYTEALVREIAKLNVPFLLLGKAAQALEPLIVAGGSTVFMWGHPSPLNAANRKDCPENFKYCDGFVRINQHLISRGESPIDWSIRDDTVFVLEPASYYLFTDGAATANGKPGCRSSYAWALYSGDRELLATDAGLVPGPDQSNNRGELTAVMLGLEEILRRERAPTDAMIISDSRYTIGCITTWYPNWLQTNTIAGKKNIDLISRAWSAYRALGSVEFRHIRSHSVAPTDTDLAFMHGGNEQVDELCRAALE